MAGVKHDGDTMTAYTASLRGVAFGEGTDYRWRTVPTGLLGYGTATAARIGRADQGQMIAGRDRVVSRRISFDLVVAVPVTAVEDALFALSSAWRPVADRTPLELSVTLQDRDYVAFGAPIEFVPAVNLTRHGATFVRCTFDLVDPRLYSSTTASIVLDDASGGTLGLPISLPVGFTIAGANPNDQTATNTGTVATEWTATVYGPVTSPRIILADTGETLEVDTELAANEFVTVDSRTRTVLLNGVTPRPSWVPFDSTWWQLPAGSSTVSYRVAAGTGKLTFAWRQAWQ